jgi:hypothetical protein
MTGDNEREIRDRLGGALDTIIPAAPPVGAVIQQGRRLRNRRRIGVVAGLAVIIGLGAALPGLLRPAHPEPAAPLHYRVTVNPPARHARSGLIATGTINGSAWRVTLSGSGQQIDGSSAGMPFMSLGGSDGSPGNFTATSNGGSRDLLIGALRRDVTDMTIRLSDGTVLNLRPVAYQGKSWVGVVLPARLAIVNFVAYSRHGELAHAVPYENDPDLWLKPGQRGLARATTLISSGTVDGRRWWVKAFTGPWGHCFRNSAGEGFCLQGSARERLAGHLTSAAVCSVTPQGTGGYYIAEIAAAARYLRLTMSDGSVVREAAVSVGGRRFAAVEIASSLRMTRWTAYGASGQQLGSGRGWTCG